MKIELSQEIRENPSKVVKLWADEYLISSASKE